MPLQWFIRTYIPSCFDHGHDMTALRCIAYIGVTGILRLFFFDIVRIIERLIPLPLTWIWLVEESPSF